MRQEVFHNNRSSTCKATSMHQERSDPVPNLTAHVISKANLA